MQQILIYGQRIRRRRCGRGARTTRKNMHVLDNVIWNALTTRQAGFALGDNGARRFLSAIGPLSGLECANDRGYASLAALLHDTRTAAVFLDEPYKAHPEFEWIAGAPLVQMVSENGKSLASHLDANAEMIELDSRHSPEMIELTARTKPGPFGTRTHELGRYVGIRQDGKLVAMAGERLKVPGYTEVSAVCTHPDYLGRGYAGALMSEVMRCIRERGETPFLHSRGDNARAIALYERLGFVTRKMGYFAVLRKTNGTT
jgi:ribosomal protein S18 acetylase RimI-like enzyme